MTPPFNSWGMWIDDAPVAPVEPVSPVRGEGVERTGAVLNEVRAWWQRFVLTVDPADLDLLSLWSAHSHLVVETYTTPRLVLDSPVHGSGKTTVLEHLERLCLRPVQMASLSSPALLTRMLDASMRTILIDEADRSLNPDKEGVAELLAVLNSGYKKGGTRPVLVPSKDGWNVAEMPTFAPVVMAGNNPNLPDDTRSRTIRVLLLPDLEGRVEESDWEVIDAPARDLGARLATWSDSVRDEVRETRPPLPDGIRGRNRERWLPLKRVAVAAGGRWPEAVDRMAISDKEQQEQDREDGMVRDRPAVVLIRRLAEVWPGVAPFVATHGLVSQLVAEYPEEWGSASPFGKALTEQRFGRMLATAYKVNSTRVERTGPRGYARAALAPAWRALGIEPAQPVQPASTVSIAASRSLPVRLALTTAHVRQRHDRDGARPRRRHRRSAPGRGRGSRPRPGLLARRRAVLVRRGVGSAPRRPSRVEVPRRFLSRARARTGGGAVTAPATVQRLGTAVLVQGAAVPALARLAARGLRDRDRDGLPPSPSLAALVAVIEAAADAAGDVSPARPAGRPALATSAGWEPPRGVTSSEAADLLGLSVRQVRRLKEDLGGWYGGTKLMFDPERIAEYGAMRSKHD